MFCKQLETSTCRSRALTIDQTTTGICMESLIASIVSANLGPKWAQLCTRLELAPRDRYRFVTQHQDKEQEEKYRCCLMDTIEKWRSTEPVQKLDEKEAMRLLLCALEKIQGFKRLASDLGQANGITLHPTPPTPVTDVPPAPPPSSVAPTHTHQTTEANLGLRTSTSKLRPAVPSDSTPPSQLTKAFDNGGDIPTQQVAWTRMKRLPGPSKAIEVEINHSSFESDSGHLSAQGSEVMLLSTGNPECPGQVAGSGQSHELGQTSNHLPPWEGIQHELNGLSQTQKEPSHSSYAEMDEDSYGTYRVGGNGHFERGEMESTCSDSESGSENNSYKICSDSTAADISRSSHVYADSETDDELITNNTRSSSSLITEANNQCLQTPINLSNKIHKYALLDVCQRLPMDRWHQLADALKLSKDTVDRLGNEESVEERYYMTLKEWAEVKDEASFEELEMALRSCCQEGAITAMKMRLDETRQVL